MKVFFRGGETYLDFPDDGSELGLETDTRLVVARVVPDAPAARADVHGGDVLRAVDGTRVRSREEVESALRGKRAATLRIERGGKPLEVAVAFGER